MRHSSVLFCAGVEEDSRRTMVDVLVSGVDSVLLQQRKVESMAATNILLRW